MKNNTPTGNKIMHYAASAAAFLALNNVSGTVIYTDLDPDLAAGGEGGEIILDINEDGDDDFIFVAYGIIGTGTYFGFNFTYDLKLVGASALNGNEFVGSLVSSSGYSAVYSPVLPAGEGINSEDEFAEGAGTLGISLNVSLSGLPYYEVVNGNWLGTEMDFMGFRINIDKDHYYGWMRISVNEDATLITVHDYAYEDEANKAIFTGQTATDIIENPLADTKIFSNGANVYVQLPTEQSHNADIAIFDLSGKQVKAMGQAAGNISLDCSELPNGNYLVYVTEGELSIKKQVNLTK
jgi:Secretion system C-terminal sorting domain